MMDQACEAQHLLLQAELDDELDAAGAACLLAHLQQCPECARVREELALVSAQLRGGGVTRYAAPAALRASVAAQIAAQPSAHAPRRRRWSASHAASFGAGMAIAASIACLMLLPGRGTDGTDLVDSHIRALQPGHLLDVPSSDQHTVKPWFDGRLDFAPDVPNLASAGFPLLGGRLDYLDGRTVAALVYGRRKHLIDVFVQPGTDLAASRSVQGYNIVGWNRGGMRYEAVSDLNVEELSAFARLMQDPAAAAQ